MFPLYSFVFAVQCFKTYSLHSLLLLLSVSKARSSSQLAANSVAMGRQGYVGTSGDVHRIQRQQKEREEERKRFEEARRRAEDAPSTTFKQFGAGKGETLEQAFRNETVGLVTRKEFAEKRANLEVRYEEEERERERAAEEKALNERRRKRSQLQARASKLSFVGCDDDDDDDEADKEGGDGYAANLVFRGKGGGLSSSSSSFGFGSANKRKKFSTYGKNPDAETQFLPDVDKELEQAKRREELKEEFLKAEKEAKEQPLRIVYSYWDGGGHRKELSIKQGDTVEKFLKCALDQLSPEFREVRSSSVENLMYIKEDIILPQHLTFHELIVNKARGKSGPLFDFDVRDDIRVKQDARVEKSDSHAGKVVERHWYEKNKHIFPANRWEQYDPNKKYEKYTIAG